MTTVGEALITLLEAHGVDTVFGIPGVHTVELYRGLARSKIRHVTPRHEQGAGFMADGYARARGRPGVAFVITGPGLTNTLTAMAQARADSVPMLVISGVNATATLGKGLGYLHELPDQRGMMEKVALFVHAHRATRRAARCARPRFRAVRLVAAGTGAYRNPARRHGKPAGQLPSAPTEEAAPPSRIRGALAEAARLTRQALRPLILAGGGARRAAGAAEGARRKAGRAGRADGQCARPAARPSARRAGQPQPEGRARR